MDEFIANIDGVLYAHERRAVDPVYGRLVGHLEEAVERDRIASRDAGHRSRIERFADRSKLTWRR